MVSLGLRLNVRHDFREAHGDVLALKERLEKAMSEGTARATTVLKNAVVASVVDRTSMSAEVAERITEASVEASTAGARGRVGFKPPPPGGWKITPKSGKALAFPWPKRGPGPSKDGRWVFRSVQHPGSRPYALIGRTTLSSETLLRRQYEDEVEDAVSKVGL